MGGLADNWYALGVNLAEDGVFGEGGRPTLFKPPGYPFFVAVVLRVVGVPQRALTLSRFPPASDLAGLSLPFDENDLRRGATGVYHMQGLLLATSAALLYGWLAPLFGPRLALLAGLLFGTSPYSIVLTGLLNYSVAHLFLIIAASLSLQRALRAETNRGLLLSLSGTLWGASTLVRPVTLLLPPFLCLALVPVSPSLAQASRRLAHVLFGMGLVIAPWTCRNYAVSGRLVPVNAQAWKSVWAGTVKPIQADPSHFRYKWLREEAIAIESQVAGEEHRVGWEPLDVKENLALEDRFEAEARRNIYERPSVYLGNAGRSFATFQGDLNTVLIDVFSFIQAKGAEEIQQNWFAPRATQDFHPRRRLSLGEAVGGLFVVLDVLALAGLVLGYLRRAAYLLVPGAVYLCLAVAHSITWMDLMYYYVKVPFLIVFALSFLREAGCSAGVRPVSRAIEAALWAGSLVLTLVFLFA
jgi:hypothetical protein